MIDMLSLKSIYLILCGGPCDLPHLANGADSGNPHVGVANRRLSRKVLPSGQHVSQILVDWSFKPGLNVEVS